MKKLLVIPVVLALGGCAGTVPSTGDINTKITEIQAVTRQICSFVPTAQTVARILSALGVPGISVVSDVAGQICAAVTTAPLADGGPRQAKVNGVVIRGKFVR